MNLGELRKITENLPDNTKLIYTTPTSYVDLCCAYEEKIKLNDNPSFNSKYKESSDGEICIILSK